MPTHWKETASRRNDVLEAAKDWDPVPAIGEPPETIEDPVLKMLNGVTEEKIDSWLGRGDGTEDESHIDGLAASIGIVEGTARIISAIDDFDRLEEGDVLVCPLIGPSWAPAFDKVSGVVTDQGGVSSHAAVVCREYGIPAVVCTGRGTKAIGDGDRVRIDGSSGTVEVLSKAG